MAVERMICGEWNAWEPRHLKLIYNCEPKKKTQSDVKKKRGIIWSELLFALYIQQTILFLSYVICWTFKELWIFTTVLFLVDFTISPEKKETTTTKISHIFHNPHEFVVDIETFLNLSCAGSIKIHLIRFKKLSGIDWILSDSKMPTVDLKPNAIASIQINWLGYVADGKRKFFGHKFSSCANCVNT